MAVQIDKIGEKTCGGGGLIIGSLHPSLFGSENGQIRYQGLRPGEVGAR